ncbi:MAG: phosphoribosyl-ATP diphosphatase [Candidatus Pacebacteria bacterium]|nr:phosphoribosyl-ATP diphosphatase [Candidatus Paceibacterota bacterium]
MIADRALVPPQNSHTARQLGLPAAHHAKKIGEEAIELGIELLRGDHDKIVDESADLIYHLLVGLRHANVSLADVEHELALRHTQQTGCPKLDRKGT